VNGRASGYINFYSSIFFIKDTTYILVEYLYLNSGQILRRRMTELTTKTDRVAAGALWRQSCECHLAVRSTVNCRLTATAAAFLQQLQLLKQTQLRLTANDVQIRQRRHSQQEKFWLVPKACARLKYMHGNKVNRPYSTKRA